MTSSAGRLFDAVARDHRHLHDRVSFEGQAAMELQWAAEADGEKGREGYGWGMEWNA